MYCAKDLNCQVQRRYGESPCLLVGGTSYSWTGIQDGPNDCMVEIIWTMLTFGIKPLTY